METQKFRLFISADLRKAMRGLIAVFGTDMWEKLCDTKGYPTEKMLALHTALYSNVDGKGTKDTLLIMREACTQTDWLVTFLTSRNAVVEDARLRDFIRSVLDKVNTIYMLLGSVDNHFRWEPIHKACISSLLAQLKCEALCNQCDLESPK